MHKGGERPLHLGRELRRCAFPEEENDRAQDPAPNTPYYWRATVLDRFDGRRWLEDVWPESARLRGNDAGDRTEALELAPGEVARSRTTT